jgi:hypothetical protein
MGEINYVSFLGEGQEVLDPHELQKLVPGPRKGSPISKCSHLFWSFSHPHSCPHSGAVASLLTCSLFIISHEVYTPFISSLTHLSSFTFGLGKEIRPMKDNQDFVGYKYCWCNLTMI